MLYCDDCRKAKDWPRGLLSSYGLCEICGKLKPCWDVPSKELEPASFQVQLQYFDRSGLFVGSTELQRPRRTQGDLTPLDLIWKHVSELRQQDSLPGVVQGAKVLLVHVNVPDHPENRPHLLHW